MSSYRFCRTDDVPLLVDAYNHCSQIDDAGSPMTVESFRRTLREIDLWCSSCMVAQDGSEPIAVLLAGKRDTENLIHVLVVHPDHRRRGHGRHLLTSLSAKMAILGPPRLVAEVPAEWPQSCAFLDACGYRRERNYVDWELQIVDRPTAAAAGRGTELIVPIGVDDLVASGTLDRLALRCWDRATVALVKRKAELAGLAIAADRIEAYLLYRDLPGWREIVALGCADPERRGPLLGLLVRRLAQTDVSSLRVPRVWSGELPFSALESWGFRPAREYVGFAAVATSA